MKPVNTAIITEDSSIPERLQAELGEKGYHFHHYSDTENFATISEEKEFDLIIFDDRLFSIFKDSPDYSHLMKTENVILYRPNQTAEHKMEFLKDGGWMISEGNLSEEKLHFYLEQVRELEHTIKPAIYSKNILVTSLSQNKLFDLLFNAFLEKKTIEIFVLGEVKNGRIIVHEGEIILAELGSSDDFEALIRMFLFKRGIIRVIPYYGELISHKILPSLIATNLESTFQTNFINQWIFGNFKQDMETARFVWTGNQKHVFKSHYEKKLSVFLKQPRLFSQIVEFIDEAPITILEILDQLFNNNAISVEQQQPTITEVKKTKPVPQISHEELLRKKLELTEESKVARLLMLGLPGSGKKELISLLKGKGAEVKAVRNIEFSKIALTDEFHLQIIGMEIDDSVMGILETLSGKMHGYIFLIDASKPDRFEYTNYLINLFLTRYDLPAVIVLTNAKNLADDAIRKIMDMFIFSAPVKFIHQEIDQLDDPWDILEYMEKVKGKDEESDSDAP
ncbi:MAG: hypothetical protein Kow00108_14890 [Calditrichia bacterium]